MLCNDIHRIYMGTLSRGDTSDIVCSRGVGTQAVAVSVFDGLLCELVFLTG